MTDVRSLESAERTGTVTAEDRARTIGVSGEHRQALETRMAQVSRTDAGDVARGIVLAQHTGGVTRAEPPPPGNTVGGIGEPLDRIRPARDVARELLAQNRGLFIGEEHVVGHPAQRLTMDMMGDFRAAGVRVLGLEAFDREDQGILDAYQRDPSPANRAALERASKWDVGASEWTRMIDEANRHGIRVVGMDTAERRNIGHNLSRADVNARWTSAINDALAGAGPGAKFVAYGGMLHSGSSSWPGGVNNFLGVPSIIPGNSNFYRGDYRMPGGGWGVLSRNDSEYFAVMTSPP